MIVSTPFIIKGRGVFIQETVPLKEIELFETVKRRGDLAKRNKWFSSDLKKSIISPELFHQLLILTSGGEQTSIFIKVYSTSCNK